MNCACAGIFSFYWTPQWDSLSANEIESLRARAADCTVPILPRGISNRRGRIYSRTRPGAEPGTFANRVSPHIPIHCIPLGIYRYSIVAQLQCMSTRSIYNIDFFFLYICVTQDFLYRQEEELFCLLQAFNMYSGRVQKTLGIPNDAESLGV